MVKPALALLLAAACYARPQDFISGGDGYDSFSSGGDFISGGSSGGFISGGSSGGFVSGGSSGSFSADDGNFITLRETNCPFGEARDQSGNCVRARVTKSIYLYGGFPNQQVRVNPAGPLPEPKIHYNYVFVKAPETSGGAQPLVVPPPQQKTVVYVLVKRPDDAQQQVIEVEADPVRPDVFFVRHDGQNLNERLPGGINLETALRQAEQTGQVIDLANAAGGSSQFGGNLRSQVIGGSGGQIIGGSGFVGGSDDQFI